MGIFYSLGIGFDREEKMLKYKKLFQPVEIILSDNSTVPLSHSYNNVRSDWFIDVMVGGMHIPNTYNKLFEIPYYYEIRDFFYNNLRNIQANFDYAYWGIEAADSFYCDDIREELLKEGESFFNKYKDGDGDASYMSGKPRDYYLTHALYDGLIVNEAIYLQTGKISAFEQFKPGYYWKPLIEYKYQ